MYRQKLTSVSLLTRLGMAIIYSNRYRHCLINLLAPLALSGCSKSYQPYTDRSDVTQYQLNFDHLYDSAIGILHDKATYQMVTKLSVSDFYSGIIESLDDSPVALGPALVSNLRQQMIQRRAWSLENLNSKETMGDLWQVKTLGNRILPRDTFHSLMKSALADLAGNRVSEPRLMLLLDDLIENRVNYKPVLDDYCKPQHKSITGWMNGLSLDSVACAVAEQKALNNGPVTYVKDIKPSKKNVAYNAVFACSLNMPSLMIGPLMQYSGVGTKIVPRPSLIAGHGGLQEDYFERCFQPQEPSTPTESDFEVALR